MTNFYSDSKLQAEHDKIFQRESKAPPILPPGIDKAQFEVILTKFRDIVGSAHVFVGSDLSHFSDPYPLDAQKHRPSAAIW